MTRTEAQRVETIAVRIWEILDRRAEALSSREIQKLLKPSVPMAAIEEALQWLLSNQFILQVDHRFRADGTPLPPRF
jgi:hypothetical protein